MTAALSASLKHLHELLRQLAEAESRLSDGPRQIAIAEKQVAAAEQLIEQQKATIKTARKTADELNLRLKSRESEIGKLQGQLNTAASNKEFDIIKGQLAGARKEKDAIEDSALAAMVEIDTANRTLKELEADLVKRRQSAKDTKAAIDAQQPVIISSIEELRKQVSEAESVIPSGDGLSNYRRLRSAHAAAALAELEDDFCSACNNRVTAQDMVRIRLGEFVCCRGCGRAVYVA